MDELLATDKESFDEILGHSKRIATQRLKIQETLAPGKFIPDITLEDLPQQGIGASKALDHFEKQIAPHLANTAGPQYFGFVTGGSTPASVAGDWLVSAFDQNACGSNDSIAPQIERQTIHFLKQLFGLDDAYFGSFVTGATMANFVGLALGRQWLGEQYGIDVSNEGTSKVPLKILSGTPHSSIIKSLSMSGVGRNALVKIDTLPNREAVDIKKLESALLQLNQPVIVVANAGTVNTVDFDDLLAIGELKRKYNFWLHVDAAFGGFAACSEKYNHFMQGINAADSITIDAHKWLNVPYDAAMQFTRHKHLQLKVFQNNAAYLGDPEKSPDFFHYTPESSRRFRALPSWFTLMAYGKKGHQEIVERNCACAFELGRKIDESTEFRLLAPVKMNVVCFTLAIEDVGFHHIQEYLKMIRDDGRIFFTPTIYKGIPAIRAAVSNWQTEMRHMENTFAILTEVWKKFETVSNRVQTKELPY